MAHSDPSTLTNYYRGGGEPFRFIDLFAGIGGIRLAMESAMPYGAKWEYTERRNA